MSCATSTKPLETVKVVEVEVVKYKPNPLTKVTCTELTELPENATFGDTVVKLIEIANKYYECREAALLETPEEPTKN